MSYTVLARKWRPKNFGEMAGQEHVIRALVNALDEGRVHHAFLFTGTRGVGKTTVARILAKALNCETGMTSKPCDNCIACGEIDDGRFVDLIEVDAASRTKVDDTREMLDNVQYAPTRGRYKVYLIDEVHMLSKHSFNALLKTLEEPPPHVKFLLATTDPQKLPVTVLSRCLQFNLKRLPQALIRERMQAICEAEKVPFEDAALALLARAADGSMRDALSLLDQTIAYAGGNLVEDDVRSMLGTVDRKHVDKLLEALAVQDAPAVIAQVAVIDERAPDYGGVLDEVVTLLQRAALAQAVPDALDDSRGDLATVQSLADALSAEDLQLYYQIGLTGRRDLALAPDPRGGFEMIMLRMLAFRPDGAAAPRPGGGQRSAQPAAGRPAQSQRGTSRSAAPEPAVAPAAPAADATTDAKPAAPVAADADWPQIVAAAGLTGAAKQLANNCTLTGRQPGSVRLDLDPDCEHLLTDKLKGRLSDALTDVLGEPTRVSVAIGRPGDQTPAEQARRDEQRRIRRAREALEADPLVQDLKRTFDATIADESIKPRH